MIFRQHEAGRLETLKNDRICMKFSTLGPWVNPWGWFFHFFKIFIYKDVVTIFHQNEAWRLEASKMIGFDWNLHTWSLGESLGMFFFHFFKIFIFKGVVTSFSPETRLWGTLETSKMGLFDWNFVHILFLFHFLKILIFGAWGRVNLLSNILLMFTIGPTSNLIFTEVEPSALRTFDS